MSDRVSRDLLEARLLELGEHIAYPPVPALATRVTARLQSPPRRGPLVFPSWSRARAVLVAATMIAVLATGVLVASPTTRQAVADWLGIGGIRITFDEDREARTPVTDELNLGRSVSLEEASDHTGFEVAVPAALGEPDAVYLNPDLPGGEVSLVYLPRPDLPEVGSSGAGAVVTQFRGTGETDPYLKKMADLGTEVMQVTVSGHVGFWLSGAPHLLIGEFPPTRRTAGNTLIWEDHGITYRVEADVTLQRALEIADSLG